MREAWYKKTPGIVLILILFFPVGLYLMWKYSSWKTRTKWIITILTVFLFVSASNGNKSTTSKIDDVEPAKQAQIKYTFDVPSLIGKSLDEIEANLGQSNSITPSQEQIKLGVREWDKTFERDGQELLVTYTFDDEKIVDFFISTDDPSGQTQDKHSLLEVGNLTENDPRYRIEFVKTTKDPSYFTGIKILPN